MCPKIFVIVIPMRHFCFCRTSAERWNRTNEYVPKVSLQNTHRTNLATYLHSNSKRKQARLSCRTRIIHTTMGEQGNVQSNNNKNTLQDSFCDRSIRTNKLQALNGASTYHASWDIWVMHIPKEISIDIECTMLYHTIFLFFLCKASLRILAMYEAQNFLFNISDNTRLLKI